MNTLHVVVGALLVAASCLSSLECRRIPKLSVEPPVISTKYGQIKGIVSPDSLANTYLGIPYAKPPINEYRWENPVAPDPWHDTPLNAVKYTPSCPQADCATRMPNSTCPPTISEDCLHLNVFVPRTNSTAAKAVMVFIHGGNFQFQGANSALLYGQFMASYGDIILVTIDYRLGALGFLVTGTGPSNIVGNYGIQDQRMALRWIKENIAAFGGDANKITVFGQSAGAESTMIHYLSQDMQDTFNNVIVQSSPISIPFRKFDEAMLIYFYFAKALNCTINDLACLKSKTADEIVAAQMSVETKVTSLKLLEFFEPWLPWIDGSLVKDNLINVDSWKLPSDFQFKPMIIGTLSEEAYIYIYSGFGKPVSGVEYVEIMTAGFKQHVLKIFDNYAPDFDAPDQRDLMSVVATRWVFSCSTRNFIEQINNRASKNGMTAKNYLYVFDFVLDFPGWGDHLAYCNKHVCHGTDIVYTFDSSDRNFTTTGRMISHTHIDYWANFAKYDNPNGPASASGNDQLINWPLYDVSTKQDLRFMKPQNIIEKDYLKHECDVFDSIGYIF